MNTLIFPGYGEKPESSGMSPLGLIVERSNGPNWLYSTLIVNDKPSCFESLKIPPRSSPGFRGTDRELTSKSLAPQTSIAAGNARKMSAFVSWKNTTQRIPEETHLSSTPF